MRTLDRAVRSLDKGGAALHLPFRSWADKHISIRRGEVSMIAGPPGAGKSTVALALALKTQVPTLYASADSHESTMAIRSVSMITGLPQSEVESRMMMDVDWASGLLKHTAVTSNGCSMPAPRWVTLKMRSTCTVNCTVLTPNLW